MYIINYDDKELKKFIKVKYIIFVVYFVLFVVDI